jgi:hypothetical protein
MAGSTIHAPCGVMGEEYPAGDECIPVDLGRWSDIVNGWQQRRLHFRE